MRFLSLFCIVLIANFIHAQDKIEIEKRVKEDDVPAEALNKLLEIFETDVNVKWFYQEDGSKKVFEAKFQYNSKDYSVEFETNGEIYNVEVGIEIENLRPKLKTKLEQKLNELFDDYKIRKIQVEYLGEAEDLFEVISEQEIDGDLIIRYEIEVNGRKLKKRGLHELIFDSDIELISQRKIKLKSTDILDY